MSATHGARDVISVMAVTRGLASITVTVGDSHRMTFETNSRDTVSYFEVPFNSHTTGPVWLDLNGRVAEGPEIRGDCEQKKVSRVNLKSPSHDAGYS